MLNGLTEGVKSAAVEVARKSAMSMLGGLLIGVGVAFLTVAGWILIAQQATHLAAAAILGVIYLLAGCIVLIVTRARDVQIEQAHARTRPAGLMDEGRLPPGGRPLGPSDSIIPAAVEAFFFGLNAARGARTRRPGDPGPF